MKEVIRLLPALVLSSSVLAQSGGNCSLTSYGKGCGPALTGAVEARNDEPHLVLKLTGAAKSGYGVLLIGIRQIDVRIPGTSCSLLTDPFLVFPFQTDGKGEATHATMFPLRKLVAGFFQDLTFVADAKGIRDLRSTNGLRLDPCFLDVVDEDFSNPAATRDDLRNGAVWAKRNVAPASLGGTGELGDFDIRFGGVDTGKKDPQGRRIYEWNTEKSTIPGSRTLSGKAVTVTNGIYQFLSFVVGANEHLRFVGGNVPKVLATGRIEIKGAISVAGKDAIPPPEVGSGSATPKVGQAGFPGGPGGGKGGQGGDQHTQSANIHGKDGQAVQLPTGHPLAAAAPVTAGKGSQSNPATRFGTVQATLQISSSFFMVQMVSSGGGGGGFVTAGKDGRFAKNSSPYCYSGPIRKIDMGKIAKGGMALANFSSLFQRSEPSGQLFAIGGAGGGGTGAHPAGSFDARRPSWNSGSGGAGGGGALHMKAGGDVTLDPNGQVLAKGGNAAARIVGKIGGPYYPTPGGAGSGGSALIQTAARALLRGEVNALGGKGGRLDANGGVGQSGGGLLCIDSFSGDGGDGFLRVEAVPKPDFRTFTGFKPKATANNAGVLRPVDHDAVSALATKFYQTGKLAAPLYVYYVIEATVDGKKVTFSDQSPISRRAKTGEPVVVLVQGARIDLVSGKPITGSFTGWSEGVVSGINGKGGNGVRYLLRLDRSKTTSSRIQIHRVRIFFRS